MVKLKDILDVELLRKHLDAGVVLGRKKSTPPNLQDWILQMNAGGYSNSEIERTLRLPWSRVSKTLRVHGKKANGNLPGTTPKHIVHLKNIVRSIKFRARDMGLPFDLDIEHLICLFEQQRGLCFYTDVPLSYDRPERNFHVSVDRIIPKHGYIKGNVVLCAWRYNMVKHDLSLDEIREYLPGWYGRIVAFLSKNGRLP